MGGSGNWKKEEERGEKSSDVPQDVSGRDRTIKGKETR